MIYRQCICNGNGIIHQIRDYEYIQCDECKCRTLDYNIKYHDDMLIAWNHRIGIINEPVNIKGVSTEELVKEIIHREGVDYMRIHYGDTIGMHQYRNGKNIETISGFGYAVALVVWHSVSDVDPYGRK